MTWTTTPPTGPGYYWLREWWPALGEKPDYLDGPRICRVYDKGTCRVWGWDADEPMDYYDPRSLWAGPIVPPG